MISRRLEILMGGGEGSHNFRSDGCDAVDVRLYQVRSVLCLCGLCVKRLAVGFEMTAPSTRLCDILMCCNLINTITFYCQLPPDKCLSNGAETQNATF